MGVSSQLRDEAMVEDDAMRTWRLVRLGAPFSDSSPSPPSPNVSFFGATFSGGVSSGANKLF